ncbi:hypothetical protein M3J09_004651 [Ascochyta lentis]
MLIRKISPNLANHKSQHSKCYAIMRKSRSSVPCSMRRATQVMKLVHTLETKNHLHR